MRREVTAASMSPALARRHLLLAPLALTLRPACAAQPVRHDWPRGRRTPPVRLPLLDSSPWRLEAQRGHAVLLNFWAGWCDPCVAEMPSLAALAERERPSGLRVLAANYRESPDTARRFLATHPTTLDVALDADGAAAKAFDVHAFPSSVAIGADGRARFVVMGECDWSDATSRRWVDELLGRRG
jgi:thiol-disulfide isomerase/thioredoxin